MLVLRLRSDAVCFEDPDGAEIMRSGICTWREIAIHVDTLTVGSL